MAEVQPVSMTENFSISDGKSVIKLDVGVAVEALGMSGRPRGDRRFLVGNQGLNSRRKIEKGCSKIHWLSRVAHGFTRFHRFFMFFFSDCWIFNFETHDL